MARLLLTPEGSSFFEIGSVRIDLTEVGYLKLKKLRDRCLDFLKELETYTGGVDCDLPPGVDFSAHYHNDYDDELTGSTIHEDVMIRGEHIPLDIPQVRIKASGNLFLTAQVKHGGREIVEVELTEEILDHLATEFAVEAGG